MMRPSEIVVISIFHFFCFIGLTLQKVPLKMVNFDCDHLTELVLLGSLSKSFL